MGTEGSGWCMKGKRLGGSRGCARGDADIRWHSAVQTEGMKGGRAGTRLGGVGGGGGGGEEEGA